MNERLLSSPPRLSTRLYSSTCLMRSYPFLDMWMLNEHSHVVLAVCALVSSHRQQLLPVSLLLCRGVYLIGKVEIFCR